MSDLINLGTAPFAALGATLLYQLLGPTAKYLGSKGPDYSEIMAANVAKVFRKAHAMLSDLRKESGSVPPRALKAILDESSYADNEVASEYLAGVLASSKSEDGSDDRGVAFVSQIKRLSSIQLRTHYLLYSAARELFSGTGDRQTFFDFSTGPVVKCSLPFFIFSLGVVEKDEFELDALLEHLFYDLSRENLIQNCSWANGEVKFSPTVSGIQLYLWACGQGNKSSSYFFSKDLEPTPIEDVPMIFNKNFRFDYEIEKLEERETLMGLFGFTYVRELGKNCRIKEVQQS